MALRYIFTFTPTSNKLRSTSPLSDDIDLFNIDNRLEDLDNIIKKSKKEIGQLKKEKYSILNNTPGLKLVNDTDSDEDGPCPNTEPTGHFFPQRIGIPVIFRSSMVQQQMPKTPEKSENFEVFQTNMSFADIGGYQVIKDELLQCADILVNFDKYSKYNVRCPKGLILEGPPGNGKTLLAKCFSGQINVSFIPVSGSQFQEKLVGVGSSRVRELFELAKKVKPCIVFIDEIDAIGRKRSENGESGQEHDATLNELLIALDGFKTEPGVFVMGATNRADLLDPALTRPGRIDKTIYVSYPDAKTREAIVRIHIQGKPVDNSVKIDDLVEMTQGLSGAQIENWLNEAMLYAIRQQKYDSVIKKTDLDFILNRILVGTQSTENLFTSELLFQIAIHEMGHAIVGILSTDYNKLSKVSLNIWSPKTPGYTLFQVKENELLNSKKKLISHLAVLLAGRIAEEEFFGEAITTGASKDLEEVKKLAYSMIVDYGMGSKIMYPVQSDVSKETIDKEVGELVEKAYNRAKLIVVNARPLINECANLLVEEKVIVAESIYQKIRLRYKHLLPSKDRSDVIQ